MGVAAETAVAVEAEPQLSRRQRQAARRAAEAVVQEPIVEPSSASEKGADNPFHGQSVPRDRVMKRLHLKPGEADTAALQAGYELVGKNYRKIEEKKS
jgi:hypothetical protein